MPFLRFARDKRGYEHTYLIHASSKKGAPARILYWYRTPPGVRVGRIAFDDDVRRALEAQYPSIAFDWTRLMDTPPPPPDVEHWRERRRAEKAARQARQVAERDNPDEPDDLEEAAEDQARPGERPSEAPPVEILRSAPRPVPPVDGAVPRFGESLIAPIAPDPLTVSPFTEAAPATVEATNDAPAADPATGGRRRRRRGGRRRRKPGPEDGSGSNDTAAGHADELSSRAAGDGDGADEGDAAEAPEPAAEWPLADTIPEVVPGKGPAGD